MSRIVVKKFTSSGSWVAPAGVTRVCVRLWGGGAGGENATFIGDPAQGGAGGACAPERIFYLDVVPNTSYTITIGSGGTAGTNVASAGAGGSTTFGALATGVGGAQSVFFIVFNTMSGFSPTVGQAPYGQAANGTNGSEPSYGGQGGSNGPGGAGGAGGNASDAGTASAGSAAAANSGGGGGGGGGTNSGTTGNGGAGGSGYCEVIWVE